jgi:hypothetical protein
MGCRKLSIKFHQLTNCAGVPTDAVYGLVCIFKFFTIINCNFLARTDVEAGI